MFLPIIFIDEKRYSEYHVSQEGIIESVKSTLGNRNFRIFILSDLLYFFGQNFVGLATPYFVTVLLVLDSSWTSRLTMIAFLLTFFFYVPVNMLANRFGKKKLMLIAFLMQASVFGFAATMGLIQALSPVTQALLMAVVLSVPSAVLGILPNAVIGDIADAHGIETGQYKAGMFFGARTLMMKMGLALSNLVFPSFLLLGKSVENPLGVRLAAIGACAVLCFSALAFTRFDEKSVFRVLHRKGEI
jgi:Na+/melibiose symporter-like transporter